MNIVGHCKFDNGTQHTLVCTALNKKSQAWLLLKSGISSSDVEQGNIVVSDKNVIEIIDIRQNTSSKNARLLGLCLQSIFDACKFGLSSESVYSDTLYEKTDVRTSVTLRLRDNRIVSLIYISYPQVYSSQAEATKIKNIYISQTTSLIKMKKGTIRRLLKDVAEEVQAHSIVIDSSDDSSFNPLVDWDNEWDEYEEESCDGLELSAQPSNILCPRCNSNMFYKNSRRNVQRYVCKKCKRGYICDYTYNAYKPNVIENIKTRLKAGEKVHDIAKNLNVSRGKVTSIRKEMAPITYPVDFMTYYDKFQIKNNLK